MPPNTWGRLGGGADQHKDAPAAARGPMGDARAAAGALARLGGCRIRHPRAALLQLVASEGLLDKLIVYRHLQCPSCSWVVLAWALRGRRAGRRLPAASA